MSNVEPQQAPPQRARKFDRVAPPHDWRWWVGNLGKTLIAAGLLMFGFVAYQLWGTGIETARSQNALENEFDELVAATPTVTVTIPSDPVPGDPVPGDPVPGDSVPDATPTATLPPVIEGDPIARIELPRIGVDRIVVAGVEKDDLKKGPGHYPETPMPGQLGNAAIAGHRTTYGQPFYDLDKLENGDEIVVTTLAGRFVYLVTGQQIVSPSDYQVIATNDPTVATLTLTSCHPKYTARERLIVTAELDPAATTSPVGDAVLNYGRPLEPSVAVGDIDPTNTITNPGSEATPGSTVPADGEDPTIGEEPIDDAAADAAASAEITDGIADAFSEGWFSDPSANGQVALWGLLLAAIGIGSYLLSRRTKRDWVGLLVAVGPFLVTLYFFFQNVNRLLPPGL